jgi:hypothetical protein
MDMERFLIGLGLVILIIGIMWPILSRIGVGAAPPRYRVRARRHHILFSSGHLHHHQPRTQRGVLARQPATITRGARALAPGWPDQRQHAFKLAPFTRLIAGAPRLAMQKPPGR